MCDRVGLTRDPDPSSTDKPEKITNTYKLCGSYGVKSFLIQASRLVINDQNTFDNFINSAKQKNGA